MVLRSLKEAPLLCMDLALDTRGCHPREHNSRSPRSPLPNWVALLNHTLTVHIYETRIAQTLYPPLSLFTNPSIGADAGIGIAGDRTGGLVTGKKSQETKKTKKAATFHTIPPSTPLFAGHQHGALVACTLSPVSPPLWAQLSPP